MDRCALLLRGVNVGTRNRLPMADLRELLAQLGATDVATYVQSGNAVLTTDLGEDELLERAGAAISAYMGRRIDVTVRTRAQFERVVADNPFAAVATVPKSLCVTFLSEPVAPDVLEPLRQVDFGDELWEARGREVYAWYPGGQARSDLAVALGKLRFTGTATTRNWNTVRKLLELLSPA